MNHLEMAKWHMEKELGDLSEMNIEAGRTYALISIAEQLEIANKFIEVAGHDMGYWRVTEQEDK